MLMLGLRLKQKARLRLPDGRLVWVSVEDVRSRHGAREFQVGFDAPLDVKISRGFPETEGKEARDHG